jgi:hypothetical protein
MARQVRSPAEKKRLSYERDGRNTYGQSDKASRKAIPLFKAKSHRKARRISAQEITVVTVSGEMIAKAETRLSDRLSKHKFTMHRKAPDTPLGLCLVSKNKVALEKVRSKRGANEVLEHESRHWIKRTARP